MPTFKNTYQEGTKNDYYIYNQKTGIDFLISMLKQLNNSL